MLLFLTSLTVVDARQGKFVSPVGSIGSTLTEMREGVVGGMKEGIQDVWEGVESGNNLLGVIIRSTGKKVGKNKGNQRPQHKTRQPQKLKGQQDRRQHTSPQGREDKNATVATTLSPLQLANRKLRRSVDSKFKDVATWGVGEMFDGTDVMGTTRRRDKWESGSEHVGGDNLGEGDKDDEKFRSIAPSSTIRSRFLSAVSTSVFLRWYNNVPCILCHSTIPLDLTEVLKYLGEEDKISQYNEFLGNRDLTKDRGIELAPAGRKMKGSWFDLLDRVHWDDRGVRVGNKRDGLQQVLNDKYAESGELTLESQAEVENSVGSLSPDPGSNSTISAQPSLPNTWYIFPPKLVYGESPKILFVPPRSFISMVQLRCVFCVVSGDIDVLVLVGVSPNLTLPRFASPAFFDGLVPDLSLARFHRPFPLRPLMTIYLL